MEVDGPADVKNELPTPPASDVGSPTSFSHCGSDSEPDSPMGEDTKVRSPPHFKPLNYKTALHQQNTKTFVTVINSNISSVASRVWSCWTNKKQEAALAACWTVPAWRCVPSPSSSSPSTLWQHYSAHLAAAQLEVLQPLPPTMLGGTFWVWISQVQRCLGI